jgi:hypothetical protein
MFKTITILIILAICVQASFFVPEDQVHVVGLFGAFMSYCLVAL